LNTKTVVEFSSAIQSWIGSAPALYALEADPTSIPMELNPVDFGELLPNHYICEAARNMVIRVSGAQIRDFVYRAMASYCLSKLKVDGVRKYYIFYLYGSNRRRNPAGNDSPKNNARVSSIVS
jgi:hypothetical protein